VTWAVLESYGADHQLVRLLRDINENAQAAVRVYGQEGSWFSTSRGTRQGDPISPTVFIADLERAMDKVKQQQQQYLFGKKQPGCQKGYRPIKAGHPKVK